MRSWLRENGYTVKDRGRVPRELIAAYEARTAAPATDRPPATKSRKGRKANNAEVGGGGVL
jgi:hypothetical protein